MEGEALASKLGAFEKWLVVSIVEIVVVGRLADAVSEDEVSVSRVRSSALPTPGNTAEWP
jgi:hypothetical protein